MMRTLTMTMMLLLMMFMFRPVTTVTSTQIHAHTHRQTDRQQLNIGIVLNTLTMVACQYVLLYCWFLLFVRGCNYVVVVATSTIINTAHTKPGTYIYYTYVCKYVHMYVTICADTAFTFYTFVFWNTTSEWVAAAASRGDSHHLHMLWGMEMAEIKITTMRLICRWWLLDGISVDFSHVPICSNKPVRFKLCKFVVHMDF